MVLWVDSAPEVGSAGRPAATLGDALRIAQSGDVIMVKPGHKEINDESITVSADGVTIIGHGDGPSRPEIFFRGAGSLMISGDGVTVSKMRFLTEPGRPRVFVSGDGATFEGVEWRGAWSTHAECAGGNAAFLHCEFDGEPAILGGHLLGRFGVALDKTRDPAPETEPGYVTLSPAPAGKKRVIIVGMYKPCLGPFDDGLEVWGCNYCLSQQPNMTRLYFLDPLSIFESSYADEVSAAGIPVYSQKAYPEIPNSLEYPIADVMRHFYGDLDDDALADQAYFTSTISYMVAHAIYEGFDDITLHRILALPPSIEYAQQKPCLDYWIGRAAGAGIRVRISADSNIARPMPWESGLYGYMRPDGATIAAAQTVTAACQFAAGTRCSWRHVDDVEAEAP